ncbi:DMT family transporter [Dictyobacter kobayashii]|uniref:DMT family transporter n=1 Tax=Dictyobacter kobayashii TaxID=2014872 RepID=UPI000F84E748|nr:DMT family transporter [Dictyobacter kobayashii]
MILADFSLSKSTQLLCQQKKRHHIVPRIGQMLFQYAKGSLRLCGYGAFILMSLFSASFYPVAKPALDRVDTAWFLVAQMVWLVPPAIFLLIWSRWRISWRSLLWGCGLGSCMAIALLFLTLAMVYTSITEIAMFSTMNGIIVILISWFLFRRRISFLTWLACLCSVLGIVVLLSVSDMHWMGDALAFMGGLLLTGYSFLIEKLCLRPKQQHVFSLCAVLGIEWLTMAVEVFIYALIFGNWHSVHFVVPQDVATFVYVGIATTLLPMATMMVMRRYVNGVLLTFLGMLEPVEGAFFAFFFAHERFLLLVYVGGALMMGSLALQALSGWKNTPHAVRIVPFSHKKVNDTRKDLLRPHWPQGRHARALLAHLWLAPEGVDLRTLQCLTGIPCGCVHRFLGVLQKRGLVISYQDSRAIKYYMIHPSWHVSSHLMAKFIP